MFPANAYVIRSATDADADTLRRLAALDSQRALSGPVLIGEIDGAPAAAVSVSDERVVADPFRRTARLTPLLRMRARSLRAVERTPSVRERLIAGVRVARPASRSAA
jgi:hypothetical protein